MQILLAGGTPFLPGLGARSQPRFPLGPPQFSPAVLPGVLPGASSGFSEPATSGEPAGGWTGDEGGGERCGLLLSPKYLRPQYLPQS